MTTLGRLKTRLERVELQSPPTQRGKLDLSKLSGRELDRLRAINRMGLTSLNEHPNLISEVVSIISKCSPLPAGELLTIRPRFPRSLITHWRNLAVTDPNLPSGNFYSGRMSYHARDRLWELAEKYGWDPETGDPSQMAELDEWLDEDYWELIELLGQFLLINN
jgi:hypothetical protein